MRIVVILLVIIGVIGGVGFGLYKTGKLPFGPKPKAAKAAKVDPKAAAKKAEADPGHGTEETTAEKTKPDKSEPAPEVAPAPTPTPGPSAQEAQRITAAAIARQEREKRLERMAEVYMKMSVEEASPILEKLPDPFVIDLVKKFDEKKLGRILASMKPERAAKITNALAR